MSDEPGGLARVKTRGLTLIWGLAVVGGLNSIGVISFGGLNSVGFFAYFLARPRGNLGDLPEPETEALRGWIVQPPTGRYWLA